MTNVNTAALRYCMFGQYSIDPDPQGEWVGYDDYAKLADRLAALEAGMRGLVDAVVEHTDHMARDSTCGLCAALHNATALLNRPADGGE